MGQPLLAPTLNYLKLANQILIKPIAIPRNIETYIMGIPTSIDFEVIELVEGIPAYASLVDRPLGRQMKENISLEKDIIKLKWNEIIIIIPIDPSEGKPWSESLDKDHEAGCLYQIIKEQRDYIEPNSQGKISTKSPLSLRHNFESALYNWQIENYEAHSKYYWTIEAIPIKHSKTCYSI
jgi:hypothetical protein